MQEVGRYHFDELLVFCHHCAVKKLSVKHFKKAKEAGRALNIAARSMRILSSVAWEDEHRIAFLEREILPTPDYETIDVTEARELIQSARKYILSLIHI